MDAAIAEIAATGSLDVTVSAIAKRAGVSAALAHHYFGSKEQIFLHAMRRLLRDYGTEIRTALHAAGPEPDARARAILAANFTDGNFRPEAISAWLSFYVRAQNSGAVARLLSVYHRRLHSNLLHALRPLLGEQAERATLGLAALIDGLYIRRALQAAPPPRDECVSLAMEYLECTLRAVERRRDPRSGLQRGPGDAEIRGAGPDTGAAR